MIGITQRLLGLLGSAEAKWRWLLVAMLAALPCAGLVALAWGTADSAVTRDQWHFLPMVQDYFTGHFHAFSLWDTHSQQRTPGYKLLFLANAALFGLDLRLEIALGMAALAGSVLLLMDRFRDTLPAGAPPVTALLKLGSIALAGFSLNQWAALSYSVTALAGYGAVFCFVWLWCGLDASLRRGRTLQGSLQLTCGLAFTLLLFAGGEGPAFLCSLLLIPLGVMLLERAQRRDSLMLLAWLTACALTCELIYWLTPGIVGLGGPGSPSFLQTVVQAPFSALEYLALAFAAGVIPADAIEKHLHSPGHLLDLLCGSGVITLYATCVVIYLRQRMWSTSYLPAFLMAFSALFTLSVLVARLPGYGTAEAVAPRYVPYSQLGFIGCLWVLLQCKAAGGAARDAGVAFPAVLFGASVLFYAALAVAMTAYHPAALRNQAYAVQEVRDGGFREPDWVCPELALCSNGRTILARYRLNVFVTAPTGAP